MKHTTSMSHCKQQKLFHWCSPSLSTLNELSFFASSCEQWQQPIGCPMDMLQGPKACQGMAKWCEMAVSKTKSKSGVLFTRSSLPIQYQSSSQNKNKNNRVETKLKQDGSRMESSNMWQSSAKKNSKWGPRAGRSVILSARGDLKPRMSPGRKREDVWRSPTNTDRGLMFWNTNREIKTISQHRQQTGESLI